jgi:hypothetical protein
MIHIGYKKLRHTLDVRCLLPQKLLNLICLSGFSSFTIIRWLAVGPTQSPSHWIPGALFFCVKWPESEADQSPSRPRMLELYLHSSTSSCVVLN